MSHLTSNHIFQMLDGALDPGEQQRLSAHAAGCRKCQQELALQRAIVRGIKHQPLAATSPRFTNMVMRRLRFYERPSAVLRFLMTHGTMLAFVVGMSLLVYALWATPLWEMAQDKIQTLQPEKKAAQFYAAANRELLEQLQNVGEKIIALASGENTRLFVVAVLIILALAFFDRLVIRQLMRMRL